MSGPAPHLSRLALAGAAAVCMVACENQPADAFSGYAEADLVYLAPSAGGVLRALDVARGQHVEPGAKLFQVDNAPEAYGREAAQAQARKAEAQVSDLSKGRRSEEIRALQAEIDQARAALALSTSQLKRQRELVTQGFVTAAQLDELLAARRRDEARLQEAQAQSKLAHQGARTDAIAAAKAEAHAAQAQASQSAWAEGQKGRVAPVAATVFDVLYRPGEWVQPGAPVVALLPDHSVKVRFFVPQAALSQMKVGGTVRYACDGCATAAARIAYVSPQAEFTPPVIYSNESKGKLVYMIEAVPEGPDAAQLKPGQPLTVRPGA